MRWNNLGIAYLDQQQYDDSLHAFEQVVRLRPDYKDGYINTGVTFIEWEKYSEARAPLEKALALKPDDARALYYLALVERRQRHSEAEIADLQEVIAQYPSSRDARRELGISYYQQHRPAEAMEQFKALQQIDPDDVAAHYNLAILYRRMGDKQQAAKEAALYATKRIDPAAPTYSLDYLRKHPEISNESVPWHKHSDPSLTAVSRPRASERRVDPRVNQGRSLNRRKFIRSLSRTALVLPFADIMALAAPPQQPQQPKIGPQERSYDAKPAPPPPGPKSPIEGTPLGVSFTDVVHEAGLAVKTIYGGEKTNKYLLETTGCGLAFYDYDADGWLDIFLVNGWRLEGFPPGRNLAVISSRTTAMARLPMSRRAPASNIRPAGGRLAA